MSATDPEPRLAGAGIVECVYRHSQATGRVRLLLLLLAAYTDDSKGYAAPALGTLCNDLNLPRSSVRELVRKARRIGELDIMAANAGRDRYIQYTVLCPRPNLHPLRGEQP